MDPELKKYLDKRDEANTCITITCFCILAIFMAASSLDLKAQLDRIKAELKTVKQLELMR